MLSWLGKGGFIDNSRTVMHIAPGYWAGDMRLYYLECDALRQAGFNVKLIAHASEPHKPIPGITLYSLGAYQPSLKLQFGERVRRAKAAYEIAINSDAALFHCHGLDFAPWTRALRRATRRPVIFECREDFEAYARQRRGVPLILRPAVAKYVRTIIHLGARSSDAVVVADEGTGQKLASHARRLLVLYNFPRLELFTGPADVWESKPYDIVLYGSLPKYHLEVCLAVDMDLIRRGYYLHWYFIGRMPEIQWFSSKLTQHDRSTRFHFSAPVPHDQLATEIAKAKVGIIPLPDLEKFRNNIPQKLFELLALGIPVVMSDLPPSRKFVGDGDCVIMVPPDCYAAYADAIIRLLDDAPLRSRMGISGRERVRAHYNWHQESEKLLSLYADVLSCKS